MIRPTTSLSFLLALSLLIGGCIHPDLADNAALRARWEKYLAVPDGYLFRHSVRLLKRYDFGFCDGELYEQANGPGTTQRVLLAIPRHVSLPAPAVAVPYYFPEAMLGMDFDTRTTLSKYAAVAMMRDLVQRGFICASADAYHLTYLRSARSREDFARWQEAGTALTRDWPAWTGIGKLTADTRLMIDLLAADPRVDPTRIGIAGHSLGGKMAFYAGCLDPRVKAILASDFGLAWDSTNWNAPWYWGTRLADAREELAPYDPLTLAHGKPFFLLAGQADNADSFALARRAAGYAAHPENIDGVNHQTGHRPPRAALEAGYRFLERVLKPRDK